MKRIYGLLFCMWCAAGLQAQNVDLQQVQIMVEKTDSDRSFFGAEHLREILENRGYQVEINEENLNSRRKNEETTIRIRVDETRKDLGEEGFELKKQADEIMITGGGASGALYGSFELADRIVTAGKLPEKLDFRDAPEMVLRGQAIGLQKPYYLPGRTVYEYPYTEETFPWFYDKDLWEQVLDSMVQNRMNSLYLWNGHPFASLVKTEDYPYAVEVDEDTFRKNEEIFEFLTQEADKRGIWVIQMFYNIIVSKPFAEKHGFKTQERERPIIPVIADYTRKSIAAFVEKYPNVGLLVTLGEAMEGVGQDDIDWFTKTIIPGVQDGMKAVGLRKEPPIILRAHDTDAPSVMKEALTLYSNLYTMAKFNGEALTYETPRGAWQELHQTLSSLGTVHVENVHILANLEPFRYGAPGFIQRSVIGMHEALGGNSLHLYPQASYWDWPYTADSVSGERLLEIERNWIWYKAWSRYAWKAYRDLQEETDYWADALAAKYGVERKQGEAILEAYNEMGEISPRLLRRFGITDGNRQTMTLGMLMTQLINPYRYGLFTLLYDSEAPEGESIAEYADKEWLGEPHSGETPLVVNEEVRRSGDKAVEAIDRAAPFVTREKEEFLRLQNDAHIHRAMAYHFAYKVEAALSVLRYKYSDEIADLEKAYPLLEESVNWYAKLVELTRDTYAYANSMQTGQRKIPVSGKDAKFKTWVEMMPLFEKELTDFRHNIDSLKNVQPGAERKITALQSREVKLSDSYDTYLVDSLAVVFDDKDYRIGVYAPELRGMKGLRTSFEQQIKEGTEIRFENDRPVKVLVGFFKPQVAAFVVDTTYLKKPQLEINASANDYGQAEAKISNSMIIPGLPELDIHSYEFDAGKNILKLEKGVALILGFLDAETSIPVYDAGLYESGLRKQVDWLFE